MQTQVAQAVGLDRSQRLGHAVEERLAAEKAGAGVAQRLGDQMLAAAEADFESDLRNR